MNFRHNKPSMEPEINLTSLIDIVFLLLIFFMVTTTFSKDAAIKLQLPEALTAAESQVNDDRLIIQVDETGRYAVKGNHDKSPRQLVNNSLELLKHAIAQAGQSMNNPLVIIRADRLAAYEAVITAIDAARKAGFDQVTLSVEKTP